MIHLISTRWGPTHVRVSPLGSSLSTTDSVGEAGPAKAPAANHRTSTRSHSRSARGLNSMRPPSRSSRQPRPSSATPRRIRLPPSTDMARAESRRLPGRKVGRPARSSVVSLPSVCPPNPRLGGSIGRPPQTPRPGEQRDEQHARSRGNRSAQPPSGRRAIRRPRAAGRTQTRRWGLCGNGVRVSPRRVGALKPCFKLLGVGDHRIADRPGHPVNRESPALLPSHDASLGRVNVGGDLFPATKMSRSSFHGNVSRHGTPQAEP